jgi:gluconolactonase
LWIAVPGKGHIAVFSPVGQELDRIDCGEGSVTTNCCFGGPGMSTLYTTAAGQGKLLAIETETQGIPLPFRLAHRPHRSGWFACDREREDGTPWPTAWS